MKNNKLSELSLSELNKQKKQLSNLLIASVIVMVMLLAVLLYLIIKRQNFVLVAVIPGCMLAWLPVVIRLSQVNAEIKLRSSETNSNL